MYNYMCVYILYIALATVVRCRSVVTSCATSPGCALNECEIRPALGPLAPPPPRPSTHVQTPLNPPVTTPHCRRVEGAARCCEAAADAAPHRTTGMRVCVCVCVSV